MDILILQVIMITCAAMIMAAVALTGNVAVKAATNGDWATYWRLLFPTAGLTAIGITILIAGLYL